jgi:5-hydroxyisourate hydrolase
VGKLSTHVLDTARGVPAAGMRYELFYLADGIPSIRAESIAAGALTDDGRTAGPLVAGEAFRPGRYRLVFHVGDYFASVGSPDARKFLDVVPLEFVVSDAAANYHVPLLVSPWSYSTYRGS